MRLVGKDFVALGVDDNQLNAADCGSQGDNEAPDVEALRREEGSVSVQYREWGASSF